MTPEAPCFLLLRGLGTEQRQWWSFPERLARATGARVVCLDLPGLGTEYARRTPASIAAIGDDLRARFTLLPHERAFLVGVSLGGMVALDWCARFPADFARCVVINSSARPSPTRERFSARALATIATSSWRSLEAKERAVLGATSSLPPARLDALAREHAAMRRTHPPSTANLAAQVAAASRFEVPAHLATPVLVLTAAGDQLVSPRCSERIAAALGAPLRTHPTAGHDLPLDDPDWTCEQIVADLAGRPIAARSAALSSPPEPNP